MDAVTTPIPTTITLKGEDVYQISINRTAAAYKKGPNVDKPYYRARFRGANFVVNEDVFKDYSANLISSITLTNQTFTRPDPADVDSTITVNGWAYDSHMTSAQQQAVKKNKAVLIGIDAKMMKEFELTEETVNQLAAIQ